VVLAAACSDDRASSKPRREIHTPRRIEPPTGTVRPLPPYAITATEVGPYKLRQRISTLLDKLPSGPRIARFEIPGVLHTSLMRAEDDEVLIGGDATGVGSSTTTFVAVLGPEVARTESGVHVGTTRAELERAPLLQPLDRALDPRLAIPGALPNARLLLERDRVAAIVILAGRGSVEPLAQDSGCARPPSTKDRIGACLMGEGELISVEDDELVVRSPETDRPLSAPIRVPNLVFAAPLRNVNDGRDELVAVARASESQQRTWAIVVFRFEGRRHQVVVDPLPIYQLTATQTRWIGADLRDLELYLELASRPDGIEVGGLLTTRSDTDKIREVVALAPVTVARRASAGRPATPEPSDAGVPDAPPPDAQADAGADPGVDEPPKP
jgi:hypothetical protein